MSYYNSLDMQPTQFAIQRLQGKKEEKSVFGSFKEPCTARTTSLFSNFSLGNFKLLTT